jgi:2-polyprenyl-6-methoxyphenol hydroxylase-like FAD-dependent oxidoreductase
LDKDHQLVQQSHRGFPLLNQKHLEAFLAENAPWFEGSIERISWQMMVKFEERLARSFGKNRIWLAGDSAHITPPAGMLSMNVGMHEAVDLVERLAIGSSDEARQAALATYTADRLEEWANLLDLDHHLSDSSATDPWIHNHKDAIVGNIPASGDSLKALLAQIQLTAAA